MVADRKRPAVPETICRRRGPCIYQMHGEKWSSTRRACPKKSSAIYWAGETPLKLVQHKLNSLSSLAEELQVYWAWEWAQRNNFASWA